VRLRKCAAALLLLAAAVVRADSEDEIARCARISSPGERILCLEDALRRTDEPHPTAAAEAHAAPPAEFGFDESQKPPPPESIRVTVVAVEENAYGKLRYVTEGGQVWQQNDQRTPRYPDVPFPAEIRTAAAGSFFLQPLDGGIAVRVQRKQ
jgi:hypothetical protein